jgi:hypothetical protein
MVLNTLEPPLQMGKMLLNEPTLHLYQFGAEVTSAMKKLVGVMKLVRANSDYSRMVFFSFHRLFIIFVFDFISIIRTTQRRIDDWLQELQRSSAVVYMKYRVVSA